MVSSFSCCSPLSIYRFSTEIFKQIGSVCGRGGGYPGGQALLDKGVKLTGPLAHPGKRKEGFFECEQVWTVKECAWR
jgi:hypothetical protein